MSNSKSVISSASKVIALLLLDFQECIEKVNEVNESEHEEPLNKNL